MMNTIQEQPSSVFASMVDKLRYKSEAELKMLYQRFFSDELKEEWRVLTDETDFRDAKEEDIIKAIQKNRYDLKDV